MKTIKELKLGFSDAQNYSQRKNKKFFNDIFFTTKIVYLMIIFIFLQEKKALEKPHTQPISAIIVIKTQED